MEKIGRNEPCHCGSGKKYKNCHQQIESQKARGNKNRSIIIGSLIALAIIIIVVGMILNTSSSGNGAPGEAPAGKVWSPEHGHWHNAE